MFIEIDDRTTVASATVKLDDSTALPVKTTLYELITALQSAVTPDADELVMATVREIFVARTSSQTASRILVEFRLLTDDAGHG